MTLVARNIVANAAGSAFGVGVFLVVVPIYLALLGAEAYGLVGVFSTLVAAAGALDLGLSLTLNREVARLSGHPGGEPSAADLPVTLQAGCWVLALTFGAVFVAAAPFIAAHWLKPSAISRAETTRALMLMGATLPLVIARGFYLAGLNGLQRQTLANSVQIAALAGRAVVTVGALLVVGASVTVFFVAQLVVASAEAAALAGALWRALPAGLRGGRVRPRAVAHTVRFGAGVAGTMLLGLALTRMDHVILSALLPLREFGYYALAVAVAGVLGQLVQPVTTAIYPRFSRLVARGELGALASDYHVFSQLVAVVVLPVAAVLAVFPGELLHLWTGNADVARQAAAILALRVLGTLLNTLLHVPYVVQLAFGWSSFGAAANAIALLFVAPAIVVLGTRYGGAGAALAWVALNLGSLTLAMPWMHARVLRGELARWYGGVARPALAVAAVAAASRLAMPEALGAPATLAWMAGTGALAAAAAVGAAGGVRARVAAVAAGRIG